ncbi:MAG: hypothetical protein J2P20_08220, partial [Pseudonocardia sp.]|nr:hypothetical protein [Pseudonocardia sp.]
MHKRRGARVRARRRELRRNRRERAGGRVPSLAPDNGALIPRRSVLMVLGVVGALLLTVTGMRVVGVAVREVGSTSAGVAAEPAPRPSPSADADA